MALLAALRPRRGQWLFLSLALASLYIVLPRLGIFRHSLNYLSGARWQYLGLALVWAAVTNLLAALTYYLLAKHRLRYGRTVLIQLAGNFVDRLLPAGLGGIGINYSYLRSNKHGSVQAASVVAANNLLGVLGHLLLVALLAVGLRGKLSSLNWPAPHVVIGWRYSWLVLLGVIILAVVLYYRRRVASSFTAVIRQLVAYRKRPLRIGVALLSSIGLTLSNVLSLYYSSLGLHVHLSLVSLLVVFTVGITLGTATPTPGGLGGIEAGLVASLMAFQIPAAEALAVTLVYRLISCWTPVVLGAGAFYVAERLGYFRLKVTA